MLLRRPDTNELHVLSNANQVHFKSNCVGVYDTVVFIRHWLKILTAGDCWLLDLDYILAELFFSRTGAAHNISSSHATDCLLENVRLPIVLGLVNSRSRKTGATKEGRKAAIIPCWTLWTFGSSRGTTPSFNGKVYILDQAGATVPILGLHLLRISRFRLPYNLA
jgi:hypothetical protein